MAFKTISLAQDAYERLSAMRGPGESFTDVIRRLASPGRQLTDLAGSLPDEAAEAVDAAITGRRGERLAEKKRRLGIR